MPVADKVDLARRFYAAFQRQDREFAESLLAEDFIFTSPYDDAIDRAAYFVRCWPNSGLFNSFVLEKAVELGDVVFVQYVAATKDGKEFRNIELVTFDGERVKSVDVYFGAQYINGKFEKWQ